MDEIEEEIKKRQEEDEKWWDSIEGIVYNLKAIGDTCTCDSSSEEITIIAETLQKLPKNIRQEVLDEVTFIVFSGSYGLACKLHLPASSERSVQPLILLDFTLMRNEGRTKEHMMDTIAHEIGHYISGHMGISSDRGCERKADDLAEKWGFKRIYESYDYEQFEKIEK